MFLMVLPSKLKDSIQEQVLML